LITGASRGLGIKLKGSDVLINLTDPGWCGTDLGGPQAPNSSESSLPGVIVGAFLNDINSCRLFNAAYFTDLSLEDAGKNQNP
jgi:3-oxoacyl-[acyl-carrier protein] reductase